MDNDNNGRRSRTFWRNVLIAIAVIVVFAYAIDVTQIDLEEPLEPQRQANLIGLIRELARPDLFAYSTERRSIDISVRMPCPEEIKGSQVASDGRVILLAPNCATTTQDPLTMSGEGFPPNARGVIRWYPAGATTTRTLAEFRANGEGRFSVTFTMPDIRETEEPQRVELVEVLSRNITGLSDTTQETLSAIVETILMALIASTIGTILAVPISFLGARNLMSNVGAPLAAIMAALIALPIGAFLGALAGGWLTDIAAQLATTTMLASVGTLVATAVVMGAMLRLSAPTAGETGDSSTWAALRTAAMVILLFLSLAVLAQIGMVAGAWLDEALGIFGFVGNFIFVLADFVRVFLAALLGLLVGGVAASTASRYGQEAVLHMEERPARLLTAALTVVGTAVLIYGILYAINWICLLGVCNQIDQGNLLVTLGVPALVVGVVAGLLALRLRPKRPMPIGMVTYNITRTILNTLRAIEPVIMGFVLVVWVGIGPFAGILALMLHSIADLGKLFSEQVENIDEGPVEAVTATGATRLQTIVYAVIPQIVPHYTAFIFYRWDINVRMSTIIGFVGGGGIGLILFRSTNLTQYRQAAVMVIAIAVVVTLLDYISSQIRSRII